CRTGRAGDETDSARQTYAPRPTETDRGHSHASCGAQPATGECGAPAALAGSPPRHMRDRRARSPGGTAVALVALERRNRDQRQLNLPVVLTSIRIASTSGDASFESCRLAPVRRTASGTPRADHVTLAASLGSIGRIRT